MQIRKTALEKAQCKLEKAKARLNAIKARELAIERKKEIRRRFLIGEGLFALAKEDERVSALVAELIAGLTRAQDIKLFKNVNIENMSEKGEPGAAPPNVQEPEVKKSEILAQVFAARTALGVNENSLRILAAIASFHEQDTLSGETLVVSPSNVEIASRTGFPVGVSTIRRHIASLVRAGLILRHDSSNKRRYVLTGRDGETDQAFGFDLSPLLVRAKEITELAAAAAFDPQVIMLKPTDLG